jgi:periplasmic divalent cation tolerance protein
MSSKVVVLCTCPSEEEATKIATTLVDARLAACVNIVPKIKSIYRWKEKVEEAEEILLLIKTEATVFETMRERILKLHSYETPEIIALPIDRGHVEYLMWLEGSVAPPENL